jgi:hypothetical protein
MAENASSRAADPAAAASALRQETGAFNTPPHRAAQDLRRRLLDEYAQIRAREHLTGISVVASRMPLLHSIAVARAGRP